VVPNRVVTLYGGLRVIMDSYVGFSDVSGWDPVTAPYAMDEKSWRPGSFDWMEGFAAERISQKGIWMKVMRFAQP